MKEKICQTMDRLFINFYRLFVLFAIIFTLSSCTDTKLEDARQNLCNVSYISFKTKQREAYEIVQHFNVEYVVLAITKEGREIPDGKLPTIILADKYLIGPYSNETRFIYNLLKRIVTNEATLFYAQFNHIPTEEELEVLLSEVPCYSYFLSLQNALYNMEWISDRISNSKYPLSTDEKTLNRLWKTFEEYEEAMTAILSQNPSTITLTTVQAI